MARVTPPALRSAAVILVALASAAGVSQARVAAKPNLKVASVSAGASSVPTGGKVVVTDTTVNAGKRPARASATAFYLSSDARKDARDRRLGARTVGALKPGKRSKKSTSLSVGAVIGTFRLIACADDRRKLREAKESDNCRVSSGVLTVTATGGQPVIQEPAPTPSPEPPAPEPPAPAPPAPDPAAQIQALRAAADGPVSLPLTGAVVTYLKPAVGTDAAGFFVQATQAGPALFVAVDPATLSPAPAAGDRVSFTVTSMGTVGGLRMATAISGFSRSETGVSLVLLKQSVTNASDLVSALDSYESELIGLTGTIAGAFTGAGSGHESAPISTAGLSGDPNLRLRVPATLRSSLGLASGCSFTLSGGPMWRFNTVAQPSAYSAADLSGVTCPAPTVVSANATSTTSVTVTFDRQIDAATVLPDGSQFAADNGLTFSAASASGSTVTLTSSAQSNGTTYTVTVASSVKDVFGAGVAAPNNSAAFSGFVQPAQLRLNELSPNIAGAHDLIELIATSGGTVSGFKIVEIGSATVELVTMPSVVVQAGDLIVVHLTPAGTTGIAPASETTSKTQYPNAGNAANYDGAWDLLGNAVGLTFSNRVLEVLDSSNAVEDAVPVVLSSLAVPPSAFPSKLQAIQAAGYWLPADCGGSLCTYASTPTAVAVSVDYLGVGTTPSGNSVSRKANTDTNQNTDWNAAAAQTIGSANP